MKLKRYQSAIQYRSKKKNRFQRSKFIAKHYLVAADVRKIAVQSIRNELKQRLTELPELERQRLEMRTKYDLEMIEELGYCSGIENYSRHFDGRNPGEPAFCLRSEEHTSELQS